MAKSNEAHGRHKESRQAFIFTTDAFLALPLIIITISSFIAFTVTLRENTMLHDYTYLLSKDAMFYLSEVTVTGAGAGTGGSTVMDRVVVQTLTGDVAGANSTLAVSLDKYMPPSVGYIFEYFDTVNASWTTIRQAGNLQKVQNPKVHVSNSKVITAISESVYSPRASCASEVVCSFPGPTYSAGVLYRPMIVRIRVFA